MGTQSPFPKSGRSPPAQFSAHFYCGQTTGCIKMPLGTDVGLNPGDFVTNGDPGPPPQKGGGSPQFSAHFYCGETAGWIKMALGMEVGLSPRDVVLDGDPASPPPIFVQCRLWPNEWMDEDATCYGSRPRPRPHCIRRGPSSAKGAQQPAVFSAHIYCGHGRPSQLLLSSCSAYFV